MNSGSRRNSHDAIATHGWLILLPLQALMLHCNSLKERLSGGAHPYLHGVARSTDEHSEHDGYRVHGHVAGVRYFVSLSVGSACNRRTLWWAACPPAYTSLPTSRSRCAVSPTSSRTLDRSPTLIPATFSSDINSLTSGPPESSCKSTAAAKPSPVSSRAASPAASPGLPEAPHRSVCRRRFSALSAQPKLPS